MSNTETIDVDSGLRHTQNGLLWIGAIYLLSWKPEILDRLLAGPDALVAAVVKFLETALVF